MAGTFNVVSPIKPSNKANSATEFLQPITPASVAGTTGRVSTSTARVTGNANVATDTNTSTTTTGTTKTNTQSNTSSRTSTNSVTKLLSAAEKARLDGLIGKLSSNVLSGGNPAIQRLTELLSQSSPFLTRDQAIVDSANLFNAANRKLQEGQLATLGRNLEAGGASASALGQLFANDATTRAADALAKTQLDAIVAFTNAGTQQRNQAVNTATALGNIQQGDINNLVGLLNVAKGSTISKSSNSSTFGQTNTSQTQNTTSNSVANTSSNNAKTLGQNTFTNSRG